MMVRFGDPLRALGLGFDEAAALMGKWGREGVNTELVMGSLRIAVGKFAKEGTPLREGLDATFKKIKELGAGAEATALAMEIFGARAGGAMVAPTLDGRFAIDDLLGSMDGVVDIMVVASSCVTLAVAESVTIPNGVILISPASTSPALTDLDDDDLVFRTPISDAAQGVVLAQVVSGDLGLTSVCTLFVNNAYGQGLSGVFADTFADLGGTVTAAVPHDDAEAISYTAELSECADDDPEALIAIRYPMGQATGELREAAAGGRTDPLVAAEGTTSR